MRRVKEDPIFFCSWERRGKIRVKLVVWAKFKRRGSLEGARKSGILFRVFRLKLDEHGECVRAPNLHAFVHINSSRTIPYTDRPKCHFRGPNPSRTDPVRFFLGAGRRDQPNLGRAWSIFFNTRVGLGKKVWPIYYLGRTWSLTQF